MKTLLSILAIQCSLLILVHAQSTNPNRASRIQISNIDQTKIRLIQQAGIDLACGGQMVQTSDSQALELECSQRELQRLAQSGISYEVLIDDLGAYITEREKVLLPIAREELRRKKEGYSNQRSYNDGDCDLTEYELPQNFHLGTHQNMGGFLTYAEILLEIQRMRTLYPDLITALTPINATLTTHQGNLLHWVRISDNADTDEEEPEVLYTGLTHAREPITTMSLIYYMWYLLENFQGNAEIQNLVSSRELYFIPVVNPDGYIWNENDTDYDRMWRKNGREQTGNSTLEFLLDGVDINRNFGFQWEFDDIGSSPYSDEETYRGPDDFSEPETQMVRDFIIEHDFLITMHNHSYQRELYHPWDFGDAPMNAHDAAMFYRFSDIITWDNRHDFGQLHDTYDKPANGTVTDWCYGEHNIISWIPEIGGTFWTPSTEIDEECEEHMEHHLMAARYGGPYIILHNLNPPVAYHGENQLTFRLENLGRAESNFSWNVEAVQTQLVSVIDQSGGPLILDETLETQDIYVRIDVNPLTPPGTLVEIEISLTGDDVVFRTQRVGFVVNPTTLVDHNSGSDILSYWDNDYWGLTGGSSQYWITDWTSGGQYGGLNFLELNDPIDLTQYRWVTATFLTHWSIVTHFDYVEFQVKTPTTNWTPVCGRYTKPGADGVVQGQIEGNPLYDGRQLFTIREQIDLSEFAGESEVKLRFKAWSKPFSTSEDGFNFTDFSIYASDMDHCHDLVQNADETDIDCGGEDCDECPPTCFDGIQNQGEEGIDCGYPCAPCHCFDGVQNETETGVDCGKPCIPCAPSCNDGIQNQGEEGVDCGYPCAPCHCFDGIQNETETGVDCGKPCPPCAPSCTDGIQNQGEEGIDCGYPCAPCHCFDGIQNETETGVDCGKPCPPCAPSCTDGIQNQGETGVDCGGPCLVACPNCFDHILNQGEVTVDCGGPCPVCTCNDGIQNQGEGGIDCGGPCPRSCPYDNCNYDGIQNNGETGIDCGGFNCPPCLGFPKVWYDETNILITLAPNPASDEILMKVDAPDVPQEISYMLEYKIFTATGVSIKVGEVEVNGEVRIDLSNLPASLYIVQFSHDEGYLNMQRFIKQ